MPYANNKGTDQPEHLRSLISAFVVRCLDISLVSISEISSLYLLFVYAQTGLSQPWSQTPKTGFLVTRLICKPLYIICQQTNNCNMQYVGQTCRALQKLFGEHYRRMKKPKPIDTFLYQHFKRMGHSPNDVLVQPVEKLT